jgi:hypothetical protein
MCLARLTPYGAPDYTFSNGVTSLHAFGASVAEDPITRDVLVLADSTNANGTGVNSVLVHFHPDGTLDTSFGNGTGSVLLDTTGIVPSPQGATGLAVDSIGRILVSGHLGVARYSPGGFLDTQFGTNGIYITPQTNGLYGGVVPSGLAVDAQGRMVLAGYINVFDNLGNATTQLALDRLDVVPLDGPYPGAATKAVTVSDASPTAAISSLLPLDASGNLTAPVGTLLTFGGSFSDNPSGNRGLTASDSVNWAVTLNGQPYSLPASTVTNAPTFSFTSTTVGNYVVGLTVADPDGGSASVQQAMDVTNMDAPSLQNVLNAQAYPIIQNFPYQALQPVAVTVQADPSQANAAVTALNAAVAPQGYDFFADTVVVPVTVTLNLTSGNYQDVSLNLQPGRYDDFGHRFAVTVVINGVNGSTTIVGHSPALTVAAGDVTVNNLALTTATDSATILVSGGSLALRNDVVQSSTGFADAALWINGGTVDLGTASDPGGNVLNVNGAGELIHNASGTPVSSAIGDTFSADGVTIASTVGGASPAPSSLSGTVFSDFNADGQVDFGETGIAGAAVQVDGSDFLGNPIHLGQTTDGSGTYVFPNLVPGRYTVTSTPPSGYTQGINSVGTAGGAVLGAQLAVNLPTGVNGTNYNFGDRPAATGPIQHGQTAGIGFWNNNNGQALIKALNGGTGHQLGDWLAATFPHMFGASSSSNNLAGQNNAYVASFFQSRFVKGQKLDAQVLATALAVYVTDSTLDNTGVGTKYGFTVSGNGVATATINVGSNGAAFGVADNTTMTVMDLLLATDAQAVNGVLYNGDATKRNKANNVFTAINEAGSI